MRLPVGGSSYRHFRLIFSVTFGVWSLIPAFSVLYREPNVTSVRFGLTSGGCVASPVHFRFVSSHFLRVPWLPADMPSTSGAMASDQRTLLSRCWSCRFLGGFALLAAAAWIYRRPRALIRSGVTPGMGDVAQITFAICERRENGGGLGGGG